MSQLVNDKPPDHYKRLPEGVQCRCLHSWQWDGVYWCGAPACDGEELNVEKQKRVNVSGLHPLLVALIDCLPEHGRPMPAVTRKAWLAAMDGVLGLVYPEGD